MHCTQNRRQHRRFNPQLNSLDSKQGRTNRSNTGKSQWIVAQGYSHTYNTRIQLSRLQRIYQICTLTYDITYDFNDSSEDEIRRTYFFSCKCCNGGKHCLVSMDSDLEAFSRNPTRGSVAALAFRLAAFTKYAA